LRGGKKKKKKKLEREGRSIGVATTNSHQQQRKEERTICRRAVKGRGKERDVSDRRKTRFTERQPATISKRKLEKKYPKGRPRRELYENRHFKKTELAVLHPTPRKGPAEKEFLRRERGKRVSLSFRKKKKQNKARGSDASTQSLQVKPVVYLDFLRKTEYRAKGKAANCSRKRRNEQNSSSVRGGGSKKKTSQASEEQ